MMFFSMRRAIKQDNVSVRLCHLILYSDGAHEWEIIDQRNFPTSILSIVRLLSLAVQPNNGVTLITVTAKDA